MALELLSRHSLILRNEAKYRKILNLFKIAKRSIFTVIFLKSNLEESSTAVAFIFHLSVS